MSPSAPLSINVDDVVVKNVESAMDMPTALLFDGAQKEVWLLFENAFNSWHCFFNFQMVTNLNFHQAQVFSCFFSVGVAICACICTVIN